MLPPSFHGIHGAILIPVQAMQPQLLSTGVPLTLEQWEDLDFDLPNNMNFGIPAPNANSEDFNEWYRYFRYELENN